MSSGTRAEPRSRSSPCRTTLDYDHLVLHYRSHTEGGSSGSPVFDERWQLIGLHHAVGTRMPQLNNAGGTYPANEGITVDAIRRGLADHPP